MVHRPEDGGKHGGAPRAQTHEAVVVRVAKVEPLHVAQEDAERLLEAEDGVVSAAAGMVARQKYAPEGVHLAAEAEPPAKKKRKEKKRETKNET